MPDGPLGNSILNPRCVLTDIRSQFISKFFESLCCFLGTRHITSAAYHRQLDWLSQCFYKTIITLMQHKVAQPQRDWDIYVQQLSHEWNPYVPRSTKLSPCSVMLSHHPPGPTAFDNPTGFPTDGTAATTPHTLLSLLTLRCDNATRQG